VSDHVPVTVSFVEDTREVFGLQPGEVAVRFTREFDKNHTEHNVVRMTRPEIIAALIEFADYVEKTSCQQPPSTPET
jgi:hypothetical protein